MISNKKTKLPDHNSIFANMFNILVGPPSTGKGRSIRQALSIIKHNDMTIIDKNGKIDTIIKASPSKVTCEKIIELIAIATRSAEYEVEIDGKMCKRITAHCSYSFNIEELEVMFSRNMADMVAVLNDLYDSGDLSYETKHQGSPAIKNVCVSMLAGTTPNSIRDLMADRVVRKGFTSRVIIIFADEPRFYLSPREKTPEQMHSYDELVKYIKYISTKAIGEVTLSEEAKEYLDSLYETGRMMRERPNKSPSLDDYYGRKKLHWLKLATILHFSEPYTTREIQQPTMELAYRRLNNIEVRMHESFKGVGRNVLHESGNEILRYLSDHPGASFKKLQLVFNNDLKKSELVECLEALLLTERVVNISNSSVLVEKGTFNVIKTDENSSKAIVVSVNGVPIPSTIADPPTQRAATTEVIATLQQTAAKIDNGKDRHDTNATGATSGDDAEETLSSIVPPTTTGPEPHQSV